MARGFCPQLRGAGTICKPGSKGDDSPCLLCGVRDHDTEVAPRPEPGRLEREYGYVKAAGDGGRAAWAARIVGQGGERAGREGER